MTSTERYPFIALDATFGEASLRPYLPIKLHNSGRIVEASGLIDTGSSINVLPYDLGQSLGFDWNALATSLS